MLKRPRFHWRGTGSFLAEISNKLRRIGQEALLGSGKRRTLRMSLRIRGVFESHFQVNCVIGFYTLAKQFENGFK